MLFQPDLDQPYILHAEATDFAIGAVLSQQREGKRVPVAFFSKKIDQQPMKLDSVGQRNVCSGGFIAKMGEAFNFQPVEILTDHQTLRHWVTESVETPTGPRGRPARWRLIFSRFDLKINDTPGPENFLADAMSRWAYPANVTRFLLMDP